MDEIVTAFNVVASAALCVAIAAAIMSDRVRDGIVVKIGLILLALGMAGTALVLANGLDPSDVWRLNNTRGVMLLGALIVVGGVLWRVRRGERRSTDFIERRRSEA